MNRLIIIGNGFDLAHGLKTSYKDFVAHYLCEVITEFKTSGQFEDELMKIELSQFGKNRLFGTPVNPENSIELFKKFESNTNYKIEIKSEILKSTISSIEKLNWVDIESQFFTALNNANRKIRIETTSVSDVNKQFDYIKMKLLAYLKTVDYKKEAFNAAILRSCFNEAITNTSKKCFLTFNYTNLLQDVYLQSADRSNEELIHIHGDLNEQFAAPVLGYGDEFDKKYLEFEDFGNNELFKNIKSFEYFKTTNYYRLSSFLEMSPFEVQIYGHSCGVSDRTLLNYIFEHSHCRTIKIFYYERKLHDDDFEEKTHELYRHFKDKNAMRLKIVPKPLSRPFPSPFI